METKDIKYAEYTKYPKLFLSAYWGNHRLIRNTSFVSNQNGLTTIFENRNKFKDEYLIQKYYYLPIRKNAKKIQKNTEVLNNNGYDIRDHIEYYKCKDNTIITLFSKYISNDSEHELILHQGYTMIQPLYSVYQNTYIKLI